MTTTIIPLKLGACLSVRTATFTRWLDEAAWDCNIARNAVLRHWLRWREDHPDWAPGQRRNRDGTPKVRADGTPVLESAMISQEISKQLYHVATAAAPRLSGTVASSICREVLSWLRARNAWNSACRTRYHWQAVLAWEISVPTYRQLVIPVPNNASYIAYTGVVSGRPSPGIRAEMLRCGGSSCVARLPLWSRVSGLQHMSPIVRLTTRKYDRGHRRQVHEIAAGVRKMADSKLCRKADGWYLQLAFNAGETPLAADPTRVLSLYPAAPDMQRPFVVQVPDGRRLQRGDGAVYQREYERLCLRRSTMRYRYRHGARSGHGRSGFYRGLRPYARKFHDLQSMIVKSLVADVIKLCRSRDCGTLHYHEPTMPLRRIDWFAKRDLPFNWTALLSQLTHRAQLDGIALETMRMTRSAHMEWFGWDLPPKQKVG